MCIRDSGDVERGLASPGTKIEALYELPYQAHAAMEPMACTVLYTPERMDVWTGSPGPDGVLRTAARVSGHPVEKVFVYNAWVGGSFGGGARPRQAVHHAVLVAKRVPGRPVKVLWTREQDIAMDMYRNMAVARCRATVGADGMPVAAFYRSVTDQEGPQPEEIPVGRHQVVIDRQAAYGFSSLPYGIANQRVEISSPQTTVPIASWRAPGHVNAAFVIESFIDELAHAGGEDPYKFRRRLLEMNPGDDPGFRHKAAWIEALDLVAEKSGWGTPLPRGRGRGIAIDDRRKHWSVEARRLSTNHALVTVTAVVAEVTVSPQGRLRVDRVTVAHDIGDGLINPEAVERQIHGQFAWAMSAGIHQEITIDRGRVVQSNFHDYPMLRMDEFPPRIDIHYFPKFELIAGAGEEVIPSIMPAICNAIFAATGKRVRTLPLKHHDLSWS